MLELLMRVIFLINMLIEKVAPIRTGQAAGNGDVAPGPNESCCRLESDAALRLCQALTAKM